MRNERSKVIERIRKLLAMNEERVATESDAVNAGRLGEARGDHLLAM